VVDMGDDGKISDMLYYHRSLYYLRITAEAYIRTGRIVKEKRGRDVACNVSTA